MIMNINSGGTSTLLLLVPPEFYTRSHLVNLPSEDEMTDHQETRAIIDDKLAVALSHLPSKKEMLTMNATLLGIVIAMLVGSVAILDTGAGISGIFASEVEANRQDIMNVKGAVISNRLQIKDLEKKVDEGNVAILDAIEAQSKK